MTYNEAKNWCAELTDAWKQVDFKKILEIFSDVQCYYEDPFSEPGSSPEEIKAFWEEIQFQKIQKLEMCPIAVDGDVMIVRWYLDYMDKRTDEVFVMDGIYHVEFNTEKKCKKFTQWWVLKE